MEKSSPQLVLQTPKLVRKTTDPQLSTPKTNVRKTMATPVVTPSTFDAFLMAKPSNPRSSSRSSDTNLL